MQAVSVTLVRGKNCFLVKAVMCYSIDAGKVELI